MERAYTDSCESLIESKRDRTKSSAGRTIATGAGPTFSTEIDVMLVTVGDIVEGEVFVVEVFITLNPVEISVKLITPSLLAGNLRLMFPDEEKL